MNQSVMHADPDEILFQSKFLQFLKEFTCNEDDISQYQLEISDNQQLVKYYIKQADHMKYNAKYTLEVDFRHIREWSAQQKNYDLSYFLNQGHEVSQNYIKFEFLLNKTVEQFMYQLFTVLEQDGERYFLAIKNLDSIQKIRDMKTIYIGKLVSISGTITRTTEVRPELIQGNFLCLQCNTENKHIVQQFKFTEPKMCVNQSCANRQKWELIVQDSLFSDFQKLRIQENSEEIPPGCMPRSMDVIVRDELTEKYFIIKRSKPGDRCVFVGSLIAVPDISSLVKAGERAEMHQRGETIRKNLTQPMDSISGLKALGVRELNYKLIFISQYVQIYNSNLNQDEDSSEFEDFNQQNIQKYAKIFKQNPYETLSKQIAPTVFGHEQIKKGILLQIVSGLHKKTRQGIKLRGDINVFLVGDPSTAKSQFLKFVNAFVPRSVYTSGKATSAAGLTASVLKDPETGELIIEAGALMLADNGICCIDEFEKMNLKDQVAIHEAMEQQTITISKAGIQVLLIQKATLNSRAAVLAAANPIYGRYDKSKSLKANINLSAPIMSRFDLFFVVLDDCDENLDFTLAKHIVNLHQKRDQAVQESMDQYISFDDFQKIIRYCKSLKPQFTTAAAQAIKDSYVYLRANDLASSKNAYRITIRQLESLIRLSEAIAKVHGSLEIIPQYVQEACRLLSNSIIKIEQNDINIEAYDQQIERDYNQETNMIVIILNQDEVQEDNQFIQKKQRIPLKYEEYEQISRGLMYHLKNEQNQDGNTEKYMIQNDIVNKFILGDMFNSIESIDDANKLSKICHSVIQKLITQERTLIVVEVIQLQKDNKDYKQRKLTIHPDYLGTM